jgi:hypothetical protein
MFLSERAFLEFKELYRQQFSIELTDRQTTEVATKFLSLFQLIYGYNDLTSVRDGGQSHPHEVHTTAVRKHQS